MLIDNYAWSSPLRSWHPAEKLQLASVGLIVSLFSHRPGFNLLIFILYAVLTVVLSRVRVRDYLNLLLVPGLFLFAGVIAIPLSYQPTVPCWWSWSVGGAEWGITYQGLAQVGLLVSRTMAMVSAMYFLCLTTPLVELISVLRGMRMPEVISDLMYLIYRCIYLLTSTAGEVHNAQTLRLGYSGWRRSMNSMGLLVSSVFTHSLRRSSLMTTAMMSRGPSGRLPAVPLNCQYSRARVTLGWVLIAVVIAAGVTPFVI